MHTLPILWEFIWAEIGSHIFIKWLPRLPAIICAVASASGYANVHALVIGGVKQDRVQAQPAIAGEERPAVWMIEKAFVE